jgi:hypothetical protein
MASDLDLEVLASQVLQAAIGPQASEIAGAIRPYTAPRMAATSETPCSMSRTTGSGSGLTAAARIEWAARLARRLSAS